MKSTMIHFCLLCLLVVFPLAEEKENTGKKTESANASEEKDWLEFYYEDPKPGEFISRMKEWASDGTLQNFEAQPALIAFTSQVMRQNRDKIQSWWLDLKDLDAKDRAVYNTALIFARVGEADAIMKDVLGEKYREFERPPKILEIPLDKQSTISMLWGFYYATGSEKAIRRIVKCFRFEEAPEKPEGAEIPEGFQPFYLELPQLAYVSLVSNMERHPRLVAICEKMHAEDKSLHQTEKSNLYDLLSEVKPDKYRPNYPPAKRRGKGE